MIDMTALRESIIERLDMPWKGHCTYDGPSSQPCCSSWNEERNGRIFDSDIDDIIRLVVAA